MSDLFQPDSGLVRFFTRTCDLIMLSLMTVFLSLTIVFSGTALTALYSTTLKMIRQEENGIVKEYIRAIRDSFLSACPATILLFVDGTLIAICRYALYAERMVVSPVCFLALVFTALLLTALLSYLIPLTARFENTFPRHVENALRLALANLPVTFFLTAMNLLPLLSVLLTPNGIFLAAFWLFVGIGAGAYANSYYLRKIFDRMT